MGINEIIIYIMVFFMVVGAVDKVIFNKKFGYGEKFEEGIMAMGALALSMVGIVSLAPVLAKYLSPIVNPVYSALGADPAMFAATLLANDMGGYPLAMELAADPLVGKFAGLILASMMGATIVFTIPVSLGIIEKEDRPYLAKGVLAGMVAIPFGCLVGGLVAGFPIGLILTNLVPIIIVALLIIVGLYFIPEKMTTGFTYFGTGVVFVAIVGLAAAIIEFLTGIVVIPGMAPITEGMGIIWSIAIVLAGAFPLVHFITKVFKKPLEKIGASLGMNEVGAAGLVASLANNIPMFGMMKDMDTNGKILNVAFAVCAAFVFGDHLGFTGGIDKTMIAPMMAGKLAGGVLAIIIAKVLFCRKTNK